VSPRVRDASAAPITPGVCLTVTRGDADISRRVDEETGQTEEQNRLLHEQILVVKTGRAPLTRRRIQGAG
jgi:hypothetical protein